MISANFYLEFNLVSTNNKNITDAHYFVSFVSSITSSVAKNWNQRLPLKRVNYNRSLNENLQWIIICSGLSKNGDPM